MVGLIWVMQALHYPLFAFVGPSRYEQYQATHMSSISRLLVIPWGVEAITTGILVVGASAGTSRGLAIAGAVLFGLVTLVTAIGAAPLHGQMLAGFDPAIHRRLLRLNWVRTLGWTARGAIALALIAEA